MGLLDYFNQGLDTLKSQPKMYDPHANAQALMGGTPMGQPQGLLNNVYGEGTDTFNTTVEPTAPYTPPPDPIEQMNPGIMTPTYQQPIGPNYGGNLPNGSAPQQGIVGDGTGVNFNQTSTNGYERPETEYYQPINTNIGPDYGVVSQPPAYDTPTDETDYAATTTPYNAPPSLIGEAFDPSLTEEEKLLREAAKNKIPWYLGGNAGK